LEAYPVIAFYVVACLMSLAALAFVLVPLLRTRAAEKDALSDAGSNLAVFRSQKREIEDEFARGAITADERDAALTELSRRLVDEVPEDADAAGGAAANGSAISAGGPVTSRRPWGLAAALALAVPVASFLIYAKVGSPDALRIGDIVAHSVPAQAAGPDAPMSDKQIIAMVDTLAQKMQEKPDDPKGWILLARSQTALSRFPEAVAAFERATALLPNDASLFADYADATVMAQEGNFAGKPQALIQKALALDPNHPKALALAGTSALRLGNRPESLKYWNKLKSLVAKDSDDYRQVESIIAEVESGSGPVPAPPASARPAPAQMATAPPAKALPAPKAPAATAPAPMAMAPKPAAPQAGAAASGVKITGQVLLDPAVASKLAAGDTLFVFARAKDGPRIPLAVMRIPAPKAGAFPQAFELTDAMSMSPGMSLSAFPEIVIEARISKSGNAPLQPGDVSGLSEAVKPGATGVKVTLSKVAP
jgi:cytochrome c-type biogenesis protein CcmH